MACDISLDNICFSGNSFGSFGQGVALVFACGLILVSVRGVVIWYVDMYVHRVLGVLWL